MAPSVHLSARIAAQPFRHEPTVLPCVPFETGNRDIIVSETACPCTGDALVKRDLRHNYAAHAIEGGLYMAALTFINGNTVLPAMVRDLGGPNWLVSFMPSTVAVGVMLPPIFTAHWLDRLVRFKPLCLITGVLQRLPFLIAGLALIFLASSNRTFAIATVALAPLLSGVACGVSFTGWQQLVARTLPPERRSSVFAVRYIMASVMGIGAGWIVKQVLELYPGARGYGVLYLITFSFVAASYVVFATIREPTDPQPSTPHRLGMWQNLRAMPGILGNDKRLLLFVLMSVAGNGAMIMIPFFAIHARDTLGQGESFVGILTMAAMVGGLIGNALAGLLGDRFGGKVVMLLAHACFLVVVVGALVAQSEIVFLALFVMFGFSFYSHQVGKNVLALEVVPHERRSSALAIVSFLNLPSLVLATGISAIISSWGGSFAYLAVPAGACVAVAMVLLLPIREPRLDAA
jgi:MFS family permease